MAHQQVSVLSVLNRAAVDPVFLRDLAADPLGTAAAAGVQVSAADLKSLLSVPAATDEELVELIRVRVARAADAQMEDSPGCGG
jgi:hypothetical protein